MKGIMFNEKYGLETAVLNGTKTRTWRADKQPRYKVGEIVVIKQCYRDVVNYSYYYNKKLYEKVCNLMNEAGATNKMLVKNELMPHRIRITAVKKCNLQDLTEKDCLKEGIKKGSVYGFIYKKGRWTKKTLTATDAFKHLINDLNGKGFWESNLDGYAYEFELVF